MKFVFVVTNLAGGGAEKALLKLASCLVQRGHRAQIVLLENRIEHAAPADVDITVLPGTFGRGWFGKRLLARRLTAHVAQSGVPDLLVSSLPFADEITILSGLPRHWCRIANTLSAEVGKLATRSPFKARRRLKRYRRLYGARPLIAVSSGVADDLCNELRIAGRIETVPNPFDFATIRCDAQMPCACLSASYVVHVGRFTPQKRHDLLLDAWARLDTDRKLVLLTADNAVLTAMIASRKLGERVIVAGFQSNPYPWIAGADLLVLCSDHEGLPNVLIEALACGTPVVATDCPSGPREILSAFPECLVPCGDAPALAAAIGACLAAPPDVARANLAAYEADVVAAAYERLAAEP